MKKPQLDIDGQMDKLYMIICDLAIYSEEELAVMISHLCDVYRQRMQVYRDALHELNRE